MLQPTLERGRLSVLQGVLEKLDPGLDSCVRYLIASCQFLQRRGFYHSLYQLQQFMMVRPRPPSPLHTRRTPSPTFLLHRITCEPP